MSKIQTSSIRTGNINIKTEEALKLAYDTLKLKYDLTIDEFWKLKKDYEKIVKNFVDTGKILNDTYNNYQTSHGGIHP